MAPSSKPGFRAVLLHKAFAPIDIASLVFLRVVFGILLMIEACGLALNHWHESRLLPKNFHFKYFGFEWVIAPSGNYIYLLYGACFLCSLFITIGLFYRAAALGFAVTFAWIFFIDAAEYLNHFYLVLLLGVIQIFLPLNRRFSLDSLRQPDLRSDVTPAWTLWAINLQTAIVYFYGGLAKINWDWLHGEPVRTWLRARCAGTGLSEFAQSNLAVGTISFGGLFFDLLIVFALLWRRTRMMAFAAAIVFHLTNNWLFNIGIFPWLGIALTSLFLNPSWPRELIRKVRAQWLGRNEVKKLIRNVNQRAFLRPRLTLSVLAVYFTWQVLMPFRHFLYPGNVSWTEEGHLYSWHMKLRSKTGKADFYVADPNTAEVWKLDPLAYLSPRQQKKMLGHPDFIHQFALYAAKLMMEKGRSNVHVYVVATAELNSRHSGLLINPSVNLAAVQRTLWQSPWIFPIDNKHSLPTNFLMFPKESAHN